MPTKPKITVVRDGKTYWRTAAELARAQSKYTDMMRHTLRQEAHKVALNSYSPYSKFRVGAACCGENGGVFRGTNIENASYGLTICAERVAIFSAVAAGVREVTRLHVCCPDASDSAPNSHKMPCGACRQVMAEFMKPDALVDIDRVGTWRVDELLPSAFKL